ncbi:hypothetical protein LGL55_21945 [Clostridium tagluense]|uniref:hypothetical protein n=1 Tax=Clostridium tagluense TaxID=360422 RepID=UPI001CF470AE|nr:hypothetical protein [Clostridium tagluense]MCB2313790.1 hypothetical protein [Clostridium tagluense]MCB2318607.1 hypothetical protein [Clostridium tagluense]MCB2323453.1 hypothetical protein [Clostridium tagluense]MCB2328254.1 hypothetical protein [Clostridium tagluense]MCB2333089.1 hypothetical protein [Clostridium tagluense]
MKITNKLFLFIITISISISLIAAIVVRLSISKFEYPDIPRLASKIIYYPYVEIEFSGSFKDVRATKDTSTLYKYIVKGKATGHREILKGAVLTEIEVNNVLQGSINSKYIYIYEPIDISIAKVSMLSTFEGYNFIKYNKEYIFCLCDLDKKYYNIFTKGKKNIFMYTTPFFGKFPLKYKPQDFAVISEKDFLVKPFKYYNEYSHYEQIFSSEKTKNKYFKEYNRLLKLTLK